MSSRRRAPGAVSVVVLGLLLLSGSAGQDASAGAASPSPSASKSAPSAPVTASPRPGRAATGTPPPAAAQPPPAVPQYRATLPAVPEELPRPARFAAAEVDIDLPVVRTGVADDGGMQLPETNREVAWYAFGSRPGDPSGTTVLAAHVDTRAEGLGPFARLRQLDRGDDIALTDVRGRTRHYTVTEVEDVKKSEIGLDQLFRRDGDPELKVLTCGGPYRSGSGYRDNIVVTARPR